MHHHHAPPPPPPRKTTSERKPLPPPKMAKRTTSIVREEDFWTSGVKYWSESFGTGRTVAWMTFINKIEGYLRKDHPSELAGPVPIEQVLKFMIDRSEASKTRNLVALDEWIIFLHRFGPIDICVGKATKSFFTPDGQMVPWFHGNITRAKAKELLLAEGRPGSFLVRFSETNPKNFTLTYLDETLPKNTQAHSKNVLLYNRGPLGFALAPDSPEDDCYTSIQELIDFRQGWSVPCLSALSTQFAHESSTSLVSRGTSAGDGSVEPGRPSGMCLSKSSSSLNGAGGSNHLLSGSAGEGMGAMGSSDETMGEVIAATGLMESDDESAMSADSGFAPHIDGDDDDQHHHNDAASDYSVDSAGSSPEICHARRGRRVTSELDDEDDEDEEEDDEIGPSIEEMSNRLRLLSTMSSCSSLDEAAAMLNRAMLVAASGKMDEALTLLDDVLGLGTGNANVSPYEEAEMQAKAAKVKGTLLQELGQMREAAVWYELCARAARRMLEEAPAFVDIGIHFPLHRYVHNQLAQHYIGIRAFEQVLKHFEEFLAMTDDSQERRLIMRDFERIARDYEFWQEITTGVLENELDTGKALYRERKLDSAAHQFRRVIQMARLGALDRLVEARALGNYATVCRDLKKYNEAILAYRLCCRILRGLGEKQMERRMLNGLSLCYVDAGRLECAREICQRLLSLTEREDNVDFVRNRLREINKKLGIVEGEEGTIGGCCGKGGGEGEGGGKEVKIDVNGGSASP